MDEVLDFKLKLPTLKDLAQIKIARSLWNFPDFLKEISHDAKPLGVVLDKMKSQIPLLPIPEAMKKNLEIYVNFVGNEIYKIRGRFLPWQRFAFQQNEDNTVISVDLFPKDKLRWTAYGTIDVSHVSELLIADDRVPIDERYEIACEFCLQEDVERLWNEMKPEEFHHKKLKNIKFMNSVSVYYWSCIMKGKPRRFNDFPGVDPQLSIVENVFKILTRKFPNFDSTEVQLKYFWNSLTEVEKRRQIERFKAPITRVLGYYGQCDCEGWCYLLSQMNFEDQKEILKGSSSMFLGYFLKRPWQHLFFPVLRLVNDSQRFTSSLTKFLSEISLDQCDDNMRRCVFDHLRPLFPLYVHNHPHTAIVLRYKLQQGQHEYMLEIMREATQTQKLNLLMEVYTHSIEIDNFPSLKILIEDWVNREAWPDLKKGLKRSSEELYASTPDPLYSHYVSKKFKEFSNFLDVHFAT